MGTLKRTQSAYSDVSRNTFFSVSLKSAVRKVVEEEEEWWLKTNKNCVAYGDLGQRYPCWQ